MKKQRIGNGIFNLLLFAFNLSNISNIVMGTFRNAGIWFHIIFIILFIMAMVFLIYNLCTYNDKKYRETFPVPSQCSFYRQFSFTRFITFDKRNGQTYLEKGAHFHRILFVLIALVYLAFEAVSLILYFGSNEFNSLNNKSLTMILVGFILFAVFVFTLPISIHRMSEFELINDNNDTPFDPVNYSKSV